MKAMSDWPGGEGCTVASFASIATPAEGDIFHKNFGQIASKLRLCPPS